ncbi:MAG: hypothetical protein Q7V05_09795 [Methanoregula sp.]|nr:hypothetical protein [Methanoregula sp.]
MHWIFYGTYRKIIEAAVIVVGLYCLLDLFNVMLDPPYIVSAIAGVFVLFCLWILPAADRHLEREKMPACQDDAKKATAEITKNATLSRQNRVWNVLLFLSISLITFIVLHFFVLYMHEFSHSFAAYFSGAKADPFNIIWGRGIFGVNCDENVDYQTLFAAGKGTTAAAIAFAGPLSNILLFIVTAALLSWTAVQARPWVYHSVFWASGITFMMVFEYVFTRSFMTHDDFGNIEHGLGLSPWFIFIPGLILGLIGLWYILTVMVPGHYRIVTPGELPNQYVTIALLSFVFFLLYIGVRILAYPAVPEWWMGCVGIVALFITPLLLSPRRLWVRKNTGE